MDKNNKILKLDVEKKILEFFYKVEKNKQFISDSFEIIFSR
jgi:hypothetical protein